MNVNPILMNVLLWLLEMAANSKVLNVLNINLKNNVLSPSQINHVTGIQKLIHVKLDLAKMHQTQLSLLNYVSNTINSVILIMCIVDVKNVLIYLTKLMKNVKNIILIVLLMESLVLIANFVQMFALKKHVIQISMEMNVNGYSNIRIVQPNHVLHHLSITLQRRIVKNIILREIALQNWVEVVSKNLPVKMLNYKQHVQHL